MERYPKFAPMSVSGVQRPTIASACADCCCYRRCAYIGLLTCPLGTPRRALGDARAQDLRNAWCGTSPIRATELQPLSPLAWCVLRTASALGSRERWRSAALTYRYLGRHRQLHWMSCRFVGPLADGWIAEVAEGSYRHGITAATGSQSLVSDPARRQDR